jgi:RNase adaptor protein for sRNA GlmZ degradation
MDSPENIGITVKTGLTVTAGKPAFFRKSGIRRDADLPQDFCRLPNPQTLTLPPAIRPLSGAESPSGCVHPGNQAH